METADVSAHYRGARGREYFARQNASGRIGGALNATKFSRYVQPGADILDFGCGGGWLLAALQTTGRRVGVEPNPAAQDQCRSNGFEIHHSIDEVSGEFDLIVSNHCLEHVPNPIASLRAIKEKLRSDGLLVLALPLDDWRAQKSMRVNDGDNHLHTWTPLLLGNTLIEAGFDPQEISVLTHAWPPHYAGLAQLLGISGQAPNRVGLAAFGLICRAFSVLAKRRQIIALAAPTSDDHGKINTAR